MTRTPGRRFAAALAAGGVSAALLGQPAAAAARHGFQRIGCRQQSIASFPGAFSRPANVVVGPLAFVGLRTMRNFTTEQLAEFGGFKSPALVRAGHRVTVSIDRSARSFARLRYLPGEHGRAFADLPHTVRFVACSARRSQSDVDGAPVTFWSGFFSVRRAPACVPVTITVDRHHQRHRRLSAGGGTCPPRRGSRRR